jgi:hypothetical protein
VSATAPLGPTVLVRTSAASLSATQLFSRVQRERTYYMAAAPSLSLQVLQTHYPVVCALGQYLEDVTEFSTRSYHTILGLIHETDTSDYRNLIQTCMVAMRSERPTRKFLKVTPIMGNLREVREGTSMAETWFNYSSV